MISTQQRRIQQHAVLFQRRLAAAVAFATTMFLFWIEEVKAFSATHHFFNKNTLIFLASGVQSLAKRWRTSSGGLNINNSLLGNKSKEQADFGLSVERGRSLSLSPLRMAWSLQNPSFSSQFDFQSPLHSFGGWYNKMEPMAEPAVYEDDVSDYTFSNPTSSWPSTYDLTLDVKTPAAKVSSPRRDIRIFRAIAGWLFRSSTTQLPAARLETVGSQASFF